MQRAFDVAAASVGLLVLAPVFAVLAVAVKIDSRGPVFYRATRVGRHGMPFCLLKYRTMLANADQLGPGITTARDNRITNVGGFLRRTKLDELPQLVNVIRGDMALVGPRPEDPRYVALYSPEQVAVLGQRPGITSPASLRFRDEALALSGEDWERVYVEQIMPEKLKIELEYMRSRTFLTDIQIIARTVFGR